MRNVVAIASFTAAARGAESDVAITFGMSMTRGRAKVWYSGPSSSSSPESFPCMALKILRELLNAASRPAPSICPGWPPMNPAGFVAALKASLALLNIPVAFCALSSASGSDGGSSSDPFCGGVYDGRGIGLPDGARRWNDPPGVAPPLLNFNSRRPAWAVSRPPRRSRQARPSTDSHPSFALAKRPFEQRAGRNRRQPRDPHVSSERRMRCLAH